MDNERVKFELSNRSGARSVAAACLIFLCLALIAKVGARVAEHAADRTSSITKRSHEGVRVPSLDELSTSPAFELSSPFLPSQRKVRQMLGRGSDDVLTISSPSWDALISDDKPPPVAVLNDLDIDALAQPLSLMRLFGYPEQDILTAGLHQNITEHSEDNSADSHPAITQDALSRWVIFAYSDIARDFFHRQQYFLGINAMQEGLARARLAAPANLSGADSLSAKISPLIIASTFFPSTMSGNGLHQSELSSIAESVLDTRYDTLSGLANPDPYSRSLAAYATAVVKFQNKDYDGAGKAFSHQLEDAPSPEIQDLVRLMLIRSTFYGALTKSDHVKALAKSLEVTTRGSTEDVQDNPPVEYSEPVAIQHFARLLVKEMIDAGVLQAKYHRKATTQLPAAPAIAPQNTPEVRTAVRVARSSCRESTTTIQKQIRAFNGAFWRQQATDYRNALGGFCDQYR